MIARAAARFDTSAIAAVSSALLKFTPQVGMTGTIIPATNIFTCRPTIAGYSWPAWPRAIYQEVFAAYDAELWGGMTEIGAKYVYDLTAKYESAVDFDIGLAEMIHDVGNIPDSTLGSHTLKAIDPYLELVPSSNLDAPGIGGTDDWTIFKWLEPSKPIKAITLYALDGDRLGRQQRPPRETTVMPRVHLRVRSYEAVEAMRKMQCIEEIIDTVSDKTITLTPPIGDDYNVLVKHVQRADNFLPIGRDENNAFLWTMDVRIVLG